MVLSVESIYCYCFKTTEYKLAIIDHKCQKHDVKKHCDENICDKDGDQMPCKSKSTITISSKIDFTKSASPLSEFTAIIENHTSYNFADLIYSSCISTFNYRDPLLPEYLHTNPYFQSFLC
jgi:hypothetical protein